MKSNGDNNVILSTGLLLLIICIVFLSSIELLVTVHNGWWFRHEFEKYSVLEDVRGEMTMDDATAAMNETVSYILGRSELTSADGIMTVIDGQNTRFLSDEGATHIDECRALVAKAKVVRLVMVIAVLLILALMWWKQRHFSMYGILMGTAPILIVSGAVVVCGFDNAFALMHRLLFTDSSWVMDPNRDNIINLLPLGFFRDTAVAATGVTAVIAVLVARYIQGGINE